MKIEQFLIGFIFDLALVFFMEWINGGSVFFKSKLAATS